MRPATRKWLFALLGLAMIAVASTRIAPLNKAREKNNLVLPPLPETVQPSMLLTPLLAVGRAPLVDYLWMRATKLKEQGRFFDAYQLSETICQLQPKFASVWAFQAWNMSYNISVTLSTPEERWRWVRNGYELLRDQGIPLNPNNTQLYRELAWILFHKVGDYMDEMHYYYKLQFALQVEDILGEPSDDYVRPGLIRGDFYRDYDYEPLAKAPLTAAELLAEPGVKDFAGRLGAFGFDASKPGIFLGLLSNLKTNDVQIPQTPPGQEAERLAALKALVSDPATAKARATIEHFWRAERLRNELKLDPDRILRLQKEFGVSFDWRLPETHALYWSTLGVEKGTDEREYVDVQKLNTSRIEFFCIQRMYQRGRLAMSPNAKLGEPPLFSPDMRMVPILFDAYLRDSKQYVQTEQDAKQPVSTNFESGFEGFVRGAMLRYYELGQRAEALKLFNFMHDNFPDPMYEHGLEGFVSQQFLIDRTMGDERVTMARVRFLVTDALRFYAFGEDDQAVARLNRAKQIFDAYQQQTSSDRMKIQFAFPKIVENIVQESDWDRAPRGAYERVCQKLGIQPLPRKESSRSDETGAPPTNEEEAETGSGEGAGT